ncbi:riboflavin kinase [Candidatus Dojkabacteria bacterium]|uniref:riboflavin kinase n=1 Tax=Candidatus Dojkabacteria bacterium TaxID=2099670 RepID=A0A955L788_9BACT|nr:riboflavin kinase [Candidatus Dojkabacteria bacterium]
MSKDEIKINKKFQGVVVEGSKKGREIGFPTANLNVKEDFELAYGVYACKVRVEHGFYQGILHYGPKLTFGEIIPLFEVHILGLNRDIYGMVLEIELVSYIRGTMKFADEEKLQKQIQSDLEKAKQIFLNEN